MAYTTGAKSGYTRENSRRSRPGGNPRRDLLALACCGARLDDLAGPFAVPPLIQRPPHYGDAQRAELGQNLQHALTDAASNLAGSLTNHALVLGETGRRAEAVPVSQEAVTHYRELAGLNRDAYLPNLASSLNNHAVRLAETGRRAEAIEVSQEAVTLLRELAEANRDAYLPDYTQSVTVLGYVLIENAQPRDAIVPLVEGLVLGQQLPEYAQGIVTMIADLLRYAHAQDPPGVTESFRAITGQDIPAWMQERPA